MSSARRSVVLTTDVGVEMDDQWALAHLALSPEIDLLGVVTTHAPTLPAPAAEPRAYRQLVEADVVILVERKRYCFSKTSFAIDAAVIAVGHPE